jgi:hypothetical protein
VLGKPALRVEGSKGTPTLRSFILRSRVLAHPCPPHQPRKATASPSPSPAQPDQHTAAPAAPTAAQVQPQRYYYRSSYSARSPVDVPDAEYLKQFLSYITYQPGR